MIGSSEGLRVTSCNFAPARIAAIVALVAALGLAGCGRRSGLDAPPGADAREPKLIGTLPTQQRMPNIGDDDPAAAKPVAPPAAKKRPIPLLDWLLN
jgi:predicted small lipoprotein YifL